MTASETKAMKFGIYTIGEMARILRLPTNTVRRWLSAFDNMDWPKGSHYSVNLEGVRVADFHTLLEFYVMAVLVEVGVRTSEVIEAHHHLSQLYSTQHPFVQQSVLESIRTDGKKIHWEKDQILLTLDGSQQLNLQLIRVFFKKLNFDNKGKVRLFWPMGTEKAILMDPERRFGQPSH
ncbi:MAG: DUF433 domain-containing protein [Cytophagales bacterium]|nr:DUF433 domain-containing protein [Cytophagales bacterium]